MVDVPRPAESVRLTRKSQQSKITSDQVYENYFFQFEYLSLLHTHKQFTNNNKKKNPQNILYVKVFTITGNRILKCCSCSLVLVNKGHDIL